MFNEKQTAHGSRRAGETLNENYSNFCKYWRKLAPETLTNLIRGNKRTIDLNLSKIF